MRAKTTNPELLFTVRLLRRKSKEMGTAVWIDLAEKLSRAKHRRTCVNISQINRCSKDDETIAVPGKVLGSGRIDHPVHVAAFSFSEQAGEKILRVGGKCLTMLELIEMNPKGSNVRILG